MQGRLRIAALLAMVFIAFNVAAHAEAVGAIRVTDRGPFQVWNGVDAEAPVPGAKVLAVIGPKKSIRINYTSAMPAPQVLMGSNWVEIAAGAGTAFAFGGREEDCHSRQILLCTNEPIKGIAEGAIVCMCTRGDDDSICCVSDTGIYTDGVVLNRAQL